MVSWEPTQSIHMYLIVSERESLLNLNVLTEKNLPRTLFFIPHQNSLENLPFPWNIFYVINGQQKTIVTRWQMYLLGNFNSNASKYLYLSLTIETRQEGTNVLVKIFTVLQAADSDHVIILTLTLCREAEVLIDLSNHGKTWYSIYSMLTNHKQLWKWFYISYISFLYIWHLACAHLVWYISMLIYFESCCCLNADDITHQVFQITKTLFPHYKLQAIRDSICKTPPSYWQHAGWWAAM